MKLLHVSTTALVIGALALTGCSSASSSNSESTWATATNVEEGGGLDQLVKDAQAEGTLNTMGLFDD